MEWSIVTVLEHGGMAEWSIAAVLKTAEPKAPGVRIPLPPFEGNRNALLGMQCRYPELTT